MFYNDTYAKGEQACCKQAAIGTKIHNTLFDMGSPEENIYECIDDIMPRSGTSEPDSYSEIKDGGRSVSPQCSSNPPPAKTNTQSINNSDDDSKSEQMVYNTIYGSQGY